MYPRFSKSRYIGHPKTSYWLTSLKEAQNVQNVIFLSFYRKKCILKYGFRNNGCSWPVYVNAAVLGCFGCCDSVLITDGPYEENFFKVTLDTQKPLIGLQAWKQLKTYKMNFFEFFRKKSILKHGSRNKGSSWPLHLNGWVLGFFVGFDSVLITDVLYQENVFKVTLDTQKPLIGLQA